MILYNEVGRPCHLELKVRVKIKFRKGQPSCDVKILYPALWGFNGEENIKSEQEISADYVKSVKNAFWHDVFYIWRSILDEAEELY